MDTATISIQRQGAKVRTRISKAIPQSVFLYSLECEYKPHMYLCKNYFLKNVFLHVLVLCQGICGICRSMSDMLQDTGGCCKTLPNIWKMQPVREIMMVFRLLWCFVRSREAPVTSGHFPDTSDQFLDCGILAQQSQQQSGEFHRTPKVVQHTPRLYCNILPASVACDKERLTKLLVDSASQVLGVGVAGNDEYSLRMITPKPHPGFPC